MKIKDLFIDYFVSKGHKQIPSAPLVPENDPSVLFNTAGMQPLIPYLMGEEHPYGKRLCDYQKCVRLTDLDEIGDKTHHTFFEMLGNWSLGDYFKQESIGYSFEFLTKVLKIPVERLAITVYEGDTQIPRDEVSAEAWINLGIPKERIAYLGREDNFWIPGDAGPCGGDTEIFYWRSQDEVPKAFDPNNERWVEIWNNVFMEYYQDHEGNVTELKQKNVDTGMGLERICAVLEGVDDNYLTSIWQRMREKLESISGKSYQGNEEAMRIVLDHVRTSVFIAADPAHIRPSNTDQGYILRRLIRRAIRYARVLEMDLHSNFLEDLACIVIDEYKKYYHELEENQAFVIDCLKQEQIKFSRTLEKGLKVFEKVSQKTNFIDGETAFHLYDTFGFPIELTKEEAELRNMQVDEEGFKVKFSEHQEKSRTASKGKFKGGLSGNSEMETRYHTATHLLNAALKQVIGPKVHQLGSNITEERLRFDFPCDHKLTEEEKTAVEALVNEWIKEELPVTKETMSKESALQSGAECMFVDKYPDEVTVYSIGNVSKELCGGPHVKNTKELGHFKIKKEESSSAGVRRIKAVLE